jgi:DNA repair protein RecN (Recombination protein N)
MSAPAGRLAVVLRQLHISGLGVFDDLDVELHPGLNVLTGETGAGKTMVTVGLVLALGSRAGAGLVREGATAARVQARFDAPAEAEEWAEDGEVILARSIGADGRSTARIGGQLTTAGALAELAGVLVEVHGQHQAQRLLSSAVQTALLDRSLGDAHALALAAYAEVFDRRGAAVAELERLREAARDREREVDLLAYQVREIRDVDPRPGESEELAAEEARLGHVERLLELAAAAQDALAAEGGAPDAARTAAAALEESASLDPGAAGLAERAAAAVAELAELARDVRDYGGSLAADPERLQEVRERIGALKALQRKYGATDDEVLGFLGEASARLGVLVGAEDRVGALAAELEGLDGALTEAAAVVSRGRAAGAEPLAAAIQAELRVLGMPGAAVEVALPTVDPPGPAGAERVELRFAAGPGQRAAALAKTASGGELSRTMLACRSVLADLDDVPTLVFDEVDAGIGGEAGLAVGARLARLAAARQVIVVTHLPQIACFADRHLRIRKDRGSATLETLDGTGRVEELSRMLAGLTGSETALQHAEELLAHAGRVD